MGEGALTLGPSHGPNPNSAWRRKPRPGTAHLISHKVQPRSQKASATSAGTCKLIIELSVQLPQKPRVGMRQLTEGPFKAKGKKRLQILSHPTKGDSICKYRKRKDESRRAEKRRQAP